MRNVAGVVLIFILWLKTADFTRTFNFELKIPAMIVMGFLTLIIAYYAKLIDLNPCKK